MTGFARYPAINGHRGADFGGNVCFEHEPTFTGSGSMTASRDTKPPLEKSLIGVKDAGDNHRLFDVVALPTIVPTNPLTGGAFGTTLLKAHR